MDKNNRITRSGSPVTFIDSTDEQSKQKGTFDSRDVKPIATNITDRGDLSTRIDDLENENIDVKVNKDEDTISVQSKDILKYDSKEEYFYLNGLITGRGVIYSNLVMRLKKIFKRFGITVFKSYDDRYMCRHLAFAVMKGYLKKEDIDKVESKDDFLKLINKMEDIEEIKQSLKKNETVLDLLDEKYEDLKLELKLPIKDYILPTIVIEPYKPDNILKEAEKLQNFFSNLEAQDDEGDFTIIKSDPKKAQTAVATICKLAKDLEKKSSQSDRVEILNKISEQLDILDNIVSGDDLLSSFVITAFVSVINREEKILEIHEKKESVLGNLQRLADSFKQHGYEQEHEMITSILKKGSITKEDHDILNDKLYQESRENRAFVLEFYMREQGTQITRDVYEFNNEKSHIVGCSESSFSEALYHLCTTEFGSLEPTERTFIIGSPNHAMQLTIQSDGDKRHIIFYDPNQTTRFKEIELPSAEMVKEIKITDFLSPEYRHQYKINTYEGDKLSDELHITIYENVG